LKGCSAYTAALLRKREIIGKLQREKSLIQVAKNDGIEELKNVVKHPSSRPHQTPSRTPSLNEFLKQHYRNPNDSFL
jgi:hypothetical protein